MDIISKLPKVELHLHIDCSLSYDVVKQIDPSVSEADYFHDYIAPPKCMDLADFLTRAIKGIALMQTKDQIQLVIKDLFRQLKADNTLYAEMRFAPLQHLERGLTPYEVVAAAEEAVTLSIAQTGIEARLILCTLRHYSKAQSMETVKLVEAFQGTNVAGFDIAADEAGFPIDNHIEAFKYAKDRNIFCTAHAGEAKGAESVWETLEYFGPSRLGHGVRSAEDSKLMDHLRDNAIHLEVCPTCNVQINIYDKLEDHPIDKLYRHNIPVSINTDARTITNTTLIREYSKLQQLFNWTVKDFYRCNVNALKAAFITEELRALLLRKLFDSYSSFADLT